MARKLQSPVPWQGFAPDADPTTPGVITDCSMVIPSYQGIEAYPRPIAALPGQSNAPAALSAAPVAARYVQMVGEALLIASADQRLWSYLGGGDWYDLTRLTAYPAALTSGCWSFDAMGVYALAVYGDPWAGPTANIPLQASPGAQSRYANVPTAPRASVVVVCNRFVMLLNVQDTPSGFGAVDGWWCSGRDDHTNWTLAYGGSTRGRLVDVGGPICAGIEFNNSVYAFKRNAIYRGDYTPGSESIWTWSKLPFSVGCYWPQAVCKDDSRIYFFSEGDLYAFDGVSVVSLMAGKIKRWAREYFQAHDVARPQLAYDRLRDGIHLKLNNLTLFFHIPTGRWGIGDKNSVHVLATQLSSTAGRGAPSVTSLRTSDQRAASLEGGLEDRSRDRPYLTTGDIGDPRESIETTEVRPLLTRLVGDVGAIASGRPSLHAPVVLGGYSLMTPDGKIELSINDRWLRLGLSFGGDFASTGMVCDHSGQGS